MGTWMLAALPLPDPSRAIASVLFTVRTIRTAMTLVQSLMPVAVKATTKGGDEKILLLTKIEVNKTLDDSATALLATEPPASTSNGAAWRKDVRPYKATP
jgi:hypothetical protein